MTPANVIDRLRLTEERLEAMAQGLRDVAGLPDPVGEVVRGAHARQRARAATGARAVRGGRDDLRGPTQRHGRRRRHLPEVRQRGAAARVARARRSPTTRRSWPCCATPWPAPTCRPTSCQLVPADTHDSVKALMRARGQVDVLIPRGGAGLIRSVVEESTVPVIETGVGNCHVYVDAGGRPRAGARDRAERQDPPHQRVQRRRVAAGARRARRRVPAAAWWPHSRKPASWCTVTTTFAAPRRRRGGHRRRLCARSTSRSTSPRPSYPTSTRRSPTSAGTPAITATRS